MSAMDYFVDVATHSINKVGEELCGDKVEIFKSEDKTIIVLADGLGSGVKANILATLTTKIAVTMLGQGEDIEETIHTIMNTLPVCSSRKIAYSTFGIIQINRQNQCTIIEYDTPPLFLIKGNRCTELERHAVTYDGKVVNFSETVLSEGDFITLVSDGVIHAGVGNVLNHGWEWIHVAEFLERQHLRCAERINKRLMEACCNLYEGKPGDDTTAVTVMLRQPEQIHLFAGPPDTPAYDSEFVEGFMKQPGKKIVCGGTAAKIISRELKREIDTRIDYIDSEVPPIAYIKGIELVTEGVLTLRKSIALIDAYLVDSKELDERKADGASLLVRTLLNNCTHIQMWVGKAINPAHQNTDFPIELSIKINLLLQLKSRLEAIGKVVSVNYIPDLPQ